MKIYIYILNKENETIVPVLIHFDEDILQLYIVLIIKNL